MSTSACRRRTRPRRQAPLQPSRSELHPAVLLPQAMCGASPQVFVITNAISRLRAKVGGHKDQGLQSPRDGGANITPADGAPPL